MTQRPDQTVTITDRIRALVIVAAGSGTRLGRGIPKAAVALNGRPLIGHAVDAVTEDLGLSVVAVVLPPEPSPHRDLIAEEAATLHSRGINTVTVSGGQTRAESVAAGVGAATAALRTAGHEPLTHQVDVAIHDAARSLTPPEVFQRVFDALATGAEAVIPAVAVSDTIKSVTDRQVVQATVDRSTLRAVQTPQGFTLDLLERAAAYVQDLAPGTAASVTDEAMIAEALGVEVAVVEGHQRALKITTETDFLTAKALLSEMNPAEPSLNVPIPRVGIGHDIHAVAPADEPTDMWLAGLHWPGEQGLAGHSDGDAVAHACCDALFAAAGIGDLGVHFGTDRPELAGAAGTTLLAEAARLVREAGFSIGNISVQFIGQRPRFGPRREEAQRVLTDAAGAPVSVSATTSDGLAFTGRGEGIWATATAVVLPVREES